MAKRQHGVGGQADGIFVALRLQLLVDLGVGKGGIAPEVAALHLGPTPAPDLRAPIATAGPMSAIRVTAGMPGTTVMGAYPTGLAESGMAASESASGPGGQGIGGQGTGDRVDLR